MKKKLLLLTFIILLIPLSFALTTPEEAVNEYYASFIDEDIQRYLAVSYLSHYSEEALKDKKEYVEELFKMYNTTAFSLEDMNVLIDEGYAYAEYRVTTTVEENGLPFSYEQDMSAILLQDNGWKIFQVIPTNVLAINMKEELEEPQQEETYEEEAKYLCTYDKKELTNIDEYPLAGYESAVKLVGKNKILQIRIDDDKYYFHVQETIVKKVSAQEEVDYLLSLDACTYQRIALGADPLAEYETGNIVLEGKGLLPSVKTGLGKFFLNVYQLFKKTPYSFELEAETGELKGGKRYSYIGPTARGPGELYLGDGGAYAEYHFTSTYKGLIHLYAKVSDDAKHVDGSRNAHFSVNGQSIPYVHTSTNYIKDGNVWGWEYIGEFSLVKGENLLLISKDASTSAAFVADKYAFFEEKQDLDILNS